MGKKIVFQTNISIIAFALYSLLLAFSNAIYLSFFLPLFFIIFIQKEFLFLKKLLILNFFISILSCSIYFTNPHLAFLVFIRSNMIIGFCLAIFHDKTSFDLAYGLQNLKVPSKISSLFYFSTKFIYLLSKEIKIFNTNLILRGFENNLTLFTYKTYANFIGLFFIKAFYGANNLQNTFILRGFTNKVYSLKQNPKIQPREVILLGIIIFSYFVPLRKIL